MHQAGSDSMFTVQVFFSIFNKLEMEADKKELLSVFEQFNQEVYGYTNEQAHRFQQYTTTSTQNTANYYTDSSNKVVGLQMESNSFDPHNMQYQEYDLDH